MRFARNAVYAACCLSVACATVAADRRENRDVASFHAIGVSAPVKVEITQGDKDSVVLEGDADQLAKIETVVENGALKIRKRDHEWSWSGSSNVRAFVTVRELDGVAISGSGGVSAPSLRTDKLNLAISGSGDMRIGTLTATKVDVSVSGSGDVSVAGKAESISGSIAGSGSLKAAKLETDKASISIAGSGDATLWTRTSLSAHIAGSGDLRYYGDPALRSSVAGSGRVKRLGATPS